MKYYIAALSSDPSAMTRLEHAKDEQNVATLNALHDLFLANWAAGKVVARSDHLEPLRARVAGDIRLSSFACTSRSLSCCHFAITEPVQEALRGMSILPSIFHPIAVDQSQDRYSLFAVPRAQRAQRRNRLSGLAVLRWHTPSSTEGLSASRQQRRVLSVDPEAGVCTPAAGIHRSSK